MDAKTRRGPHAPDPAADHPRGGVGRRADVLLGPAVAVDPLLRQRHAGHAWAPTWRTTSKPSSRCRSRCRSSRRRIYGDNSRASQDLWTQFMNLQGPAMQSLMPAYMEQSQKMFLQMQDQMQNQTRNMFSGFPFPGFPGPPAQPASPSPTSQVGVIPRHRAPRRSASCPSAAPRRWSTPSASSRSCAPRATPPRTTTAAPTSSSSTPAASSTRRWRSRSTRSARRSPRTAR